MAQDHFQTPPDPERGYKNQKKLQKSLKVRAKPAKMNILLGQREGYRPVHVCMLGLVGSFGEYLPIAPPRV